MKIGGGFEMMVEMLLEVSVMLVPAEEEMGAICHGGDMCWKWVVDFVVWNVVV